MHALPTRALLVVWLTVCLAATNVPAATSPQDLAALRQKAESGNTVAQHNLGLVYANPQEPAFDLAEAYVWLNLAAEAGARPRELATLTNRMSPEQLVEGQRRLAARRTTAQSPAPIITPAPLPDQPGSEEVRQLSEELAAAWREIEQLRAAGGGDATELRKRLAIAETALSSKERELQGLREQLTQTRSADASTADVRTERDRLAADVERLNGELEQARQAASAATERALAHVSENRQLLTQLEQLRSARETNGAAKLELEDLRGRLKVAEQAGRDAERDLAAAQGQLAQLRSAAAQASIATTEANRLRQELEQAQATLATRERDAKAAQNARQQTEQQLQQTQRQLAEAQQVQGTAGRDLDALRTQLQEAQQRAATAEQARAEAARTLATAQTELEQARRSASAAGNVAAEASQLRQQLEQVQGTLATRERELQAAHQGRGELERQLADLQQNRGSASAEAETLRTQLQEAQQRAATAEQALEEARTLAQQSAATRGNAENEVIQLRGQLAANRTELEALRRQLEVQRTQATDAQRLRDQLATLETERDQLRAQLEQATAGASDSATARDEQLAQVEARLAASLRAFTLQENEMERLRRELEDVRRRAESADTELSSLRPTLEQAQTAVAETEAARREIEQLRAERDDVRRTAESQATELASLREQMIAAQQEAAVAVQEANTFREQMRQTQAQAAVTAREAAELRTRLALQAPMPGSGRSAPSRPGLQPVPVSQPVAPSSTPSTTTATAPAIAPAVTPTAVQPPTDGAARVHTVVAGDTLTRIARQYYGDSNRWAEILEANRETLRSPEALRVGQQLRIP